MKRYIVLVLSLLLVIGMAFAVSASEEGKLLIWADLYRAKALQDVKADFEAEYGIAVEIQEMAFGDIRDNLAVSGPAGEGPDILVGAHDWLGQLIANGLLEPIVLGELADDFYAVTLDAFSWGGKSYALPYAFESIGLIYNREMVPEAPKTFPEFVKLIRELTDRDNEKYGFVMPQPDPYHTFPFMSATGGYVFGMDDEGKLDPNDIGLNNEGALKGLTYLDLLYEEGLVPITNYETMSSLFKAEKAAMMLTGPWALSDLKAAGINYGFTKIPTIDGDTAKPFVGVQGMMISSFSKNKILAQAFLTEFVGTEKTMNKLFELDRRPPAYKPVAEIVAEDPDIAGVLASAADGVPMPSIPEMAAVWQSWSDSLDVILNQKDEIKPAMDNAVELIEKTIKEGK